VSPALAEALRAIEKQYPGWRVTPDGAGHLYARREQPIESDRARCPYRPNLGADDPEGLRAALADFEPVTAGHEHAWVTTCALCGVSPGNAGKSSCGHPEWVAECSECGAKR
jgi:hypothetical protein